MITAVITKKGRILQNKQINGADLKFTRVVAGTANTPVESLQDQATISNVVQTLSMQSVKLDESEQSYSILVLLENKNLKQSYNLSQIGFYANDPNDGEILFAIAQFNTPKKIEPPTVNPGYTLKLPFKFQNSNSAEVIIKFDPNDSMTREGVQAMLDGEEISGISSGNAIAVSDSAGSPFLDFKLFGFSEQVTTTGKNKLKITKSNHTYKGVSFEFENDGTVIATGTPTEIFAESVYGDFSIPIAFPAGEYIVSGGVDQNHYVRVRVHASDGTLKTQHYDINESRRFTVEDGDLISVTLYFANTTSVKSIQFYPMIRDASIEDDTYEVHTGNKPSPSPDYPQEIESTGENGSVDLNVQGKNLWTVDNTNDNLTYDAATQIMTINGAVNLTVHELPVPIPKGTTVTISAKVISGKVTSEGDGGLAFGGYYKPENGKASWQGYINIPKCSVADLTGQEYKQIFQTTEEVTHFYAFVYGSTAAIHEPLKVKVQYEVNNYATDFEPHKTSQMANILTPNGLHGIPVESGGNYTDKNGQEWICDEINLAKRKYIQRTCTKVFDGVDGEIITLYAERSNVYGFALKITDVNMLKPAHAAICTHFKNIITGISSVNEECFLCGAGSSTIYVMIDKNRISEYSIEVFKNWLNNNPITIVFQLAEPIETDLTDEQIAAFESLIAYENTTTILMDGIGDMEVRYFKDTSNGKAMGILKSEHIYLKKLIGDVNTVVKNLVG